MGSEGKKESDRNKRKEGMDTALRYSDENLMVCQTKCLAYEKFEIHQHTSRFQNKFSELFGNNWISAMTIHCIRRAGEDK